jgi:hypothetical protein
MIDRQEARSDVARIDHAADRWLHTANRARARLKIYSKTVAIQEKQSQTAYFNNRTNRAYKA